MQYHIIVSGIPASGKTTIGRAVAGALGLPMLDKDEILETMFKTEGVGNAEWRERLSRAADEVLREKAMGVDNAVLTSWWRHPSSQSDSGTRIEWLPLLSRSIFELHCVCSPEVAATRFLTRNRHSGHLDHFKTLGELLPSFQQQAALGALGFGSVIEVQTERKLDLAGLLVRMKSTWRIDAK